jgi:hypothetical protein
MIPVVEMDSRPTVHYNDSGLKNGVTVRSESFWV